MSPRQYPMPESKPEDWLCPDTLRWVADTLDEPHLRVIAAKAERRQLGEHHLEVLVAVGKQASTADVRSALPNVTHTALCNRLAELSRRGFLVRGKRGRQYIWTATRKGDLL